MPGYKLKSPVVLIIFRRPDTTEKVFEAIRLAKPPKLFVIADAPRKDNLEEAEKCRNAKAVVDRVDWECEVIKNYAETNLGCAKRVYSGLNWVFEHVSEAIILEDDCLPDPTFFRYCEELLGHYRNDQRIMSIAGTNFQFGNKFNNFSYYHSCYHDCWGWATWKRAWQYFDYQMKSWPEINQSNFMRDMLSSEKSARYWSKYFQLTYEGNKDSWFYRWLFTCWMQNGLAIVPQLNLISNIGFGLDGTHTLDRSRFANMETEPVEFPLTHPPFLIRNWQADRQNQTNRFDVETDLRTRIKNKILKTINKILSRR